MRCALVILVTLLGCQPAARPVDGGPVAAPSAVTERARTASTTTSTTAESDPGAGDAGPVDASPSAYYEPAATFGAMEWGFEDRDVVARGRGRTTRFRPPDEGQLASSGQSGPPSCAFLDATRAWCPVLLGPYPRRLDVFRTVDGGASWTPSHLVAAGLTDWPLEPWATLGFRDAQHGTATVIDPPQHHNGHRETTWRYATRDGGKTWSLVGTKSRCLDPVGHCRHG